MNIPEAGAQSTSTTTIGPILLGGGMNGNNLGQPLIAFYLHSPGGPAFVRVKVAKDNDPAGYGHRAFLRHFDPDENLLFSHYADDEYPADFPPDNSQYLIDRTIALPQSGVHEIRLNFSNFSYKRVTLEISSGVEWGYSVQNGRFAKKANLPNTYYAALPVHRHANMRLLLKYRAGTINLTDLTDALNVLIADRVVIPPHATRDHHFVKFEMAGDWAFKADGMPLILAPTLQAAELIGSRTQRLSNGGLVHFKFQKEMFDLLPLILAEAGDGNALKHLSDQHAVSQSLCHAPTNTDDAYKNYFYLRPDGQAAQTRFALSNFQSLPVQDVSVSGHWGGSFGTPYFDRQKCEIDEDCTNGSACTLDATTNQKLCGGFDPNRDRWDVLRDIDYKTKVPLKQIIFQTGRDAFFGGPSIYHGLVAASLMNSATRSHPCNPYGPAATALVGKKELFYRGAAILTTDLLTMTRSEWIYGREEKGTNPWELAHHLLDSYLPAYEIASGKIKNIMTEPVGSTTLGNKVFDLWTQALQRLVDRHIPMEMYVSLSKSVSQIPNAEIFALASGLSEYDTYARHLARRFADKAMPSGTFPMGPGPDMSYAGFIHNFLGKYYNRSKLSPSGPDEILKNALIRSSNFANHTVAQEPDGSFLSGFNFNTNVGVGFQNAQFSDTTFLVEDLPQTAVWTREGARFPELTEIKSRLATYANRLATDAERLPQTWGLGLLEFRNETLDSSLRPSDLVFPFEEGSFVREFGRDIVAVKKPAYYTFIYTGNVPIDPSYADMDSKQETLRSPLSQINFIDANRCINDPRQVVPILGGGLSLFWTPDFGAGVVASSVHPNLHNGLIAKSGGKLYWASNTDTSYTLNGDVLRVEGVLSSPGGDINYIRTYTFYDDRVDVSLDMIPQQNMVLESFHENLPVPVCTKSDCSQLYSSTCMNGSPVNTMSAKRNGSKITDAAGTTLSGANNLSTLKIVDHENNGLELSFDQNRNLNIVSDGLKQSYWGTQWLRELDIGWIEVKLPTTLSASQTYHLAYTIDPTGESSPSTPGPLPVAICGNNILESDEECDGPETYNAATEICTEDCRKESIFTTKPIDFVITENGEESGSSSDDSSDMDKTGGDTTGDVGTEDASSGSSGDCPVVDPFDCDRPGMGSGMANEFCRERGLNCGVSH